jgi:hypothetical protein
MAADKMQPQPSSRSNKPSSGLSGRFLAEIFGTADQSLAVLEEATISPLPTQRLLLFRAHRQTAKDEPGMYSSLTTEVVLNELYKNGKTVDEFLIAFGRHLGKTEMEKQTSRRSTPDFTSTSSKPEWTSI